MITKEDIKNLADLARIEVSEEEADSLTSQIDSILSYVGEIKNMDSDDGSEIPEVRNIMREDVVTHKDDEYIDGLLSNMPDKEGRYLKVKKIL